MPAEIAHPKDWGKVNSSGCRTSICCVPVRGRMLEIDPAPSVCDLQACSLRGLRTPLLFGRLRVGGGTPLFPKMSLQSVAYAYRRVETGGLGKECTHISAPVRRRWRAETETRPTRESSQGPGPTARLCGSPRSRVPCVAVAPAGQPVSSTCRRSRRRRAPRWRWRDRGPAAWRISPSHSRL